MNKNIIYIVIILLLTSCSEESSPLTNESDSSENSNYIIEGCENEYDNVTGNLISCDSNCELIDYSNEGEDVSYDCYNSNDLAVLSDFKESNSSLNAEENILDMGYQNWVEGRLVYLSFDENIEENDSDWPIIDVIPESIGDLSELITLFLGSNEIVLIPESIGQLSRLSNLGLQNNLIESIPESIGDLTELEFLYLYNNNISSLPQSISNLSNLTTSAFSENNLCEEYHYDWITEWDTQTQDQSNCCEGPNGELNLITDMAPTVTITSPSNDFILSSETMLSVDVVSGCGISSVVFLIDGVDVFIDTEAPYEYSWDICALTEESATVIVTATSEPGNHIGASEEIIYSVSGSYDDCGICGGDISTCP